MEIILFPLSAISIIGLSVSFGIPIISPSILFFPLSDLFLPYESALPVNNGRPVLFSVCSSLADPSVSICFLAPSVYWLVRSILAGHAFVRLEAWSHGPKDCSASPFLLL
ncbi:hypothetical protein ACOSQ2_012402 [Xanthoceras sorbifolium]